MKQFILTAMEDGADISGDMLANAIRAAASTFDDPTQYFDDPRFDDPDSDFAYTGRVYGRDVSRVFGESKIVATWTVIPHAGEERLKPDVPEGVTVVPMSDTEGVVNAIAGATGESLIDALARDQDETDFGRLC
jgi:hypothetical protein